MMTDETVSIPRQKLEEILEKLSDCVRVLKGEGDEV
jgi:hypothetical protein